MCTTTCHVRHSGRIALQANARGCTAMCTQPAALHRCIAGALRPARRGALPLPQADGRLLPRRTRPLQQERRRGPSQPVHRHHAYQVHRGTTQHSLTVTTPTLAPARSLTLTHPPKQELQEALYSTAGWDSWSKLQEGDDEAQLKLGPSDDGGVPGAHETFGEAGANTEVGIVVVVLN